MYAGIAASFPTSYRTLSRVPLSTYNSKLAMQGLQGLTLLVVHIALDLSALFGRVVASSTARRQPNLVSCQRAIEGWLGGLVRP